MRRVVAALAVGAAALGSLARPESAPAAPVRAQVRITLQQSGTPFQLFGVSFPLGGVGYAVGVNGTILHTNDGGSAWTPQSAPVRTRADGFKEDLDGVSFPDVLNGHAVGFDGSILATSDGGLNWVAQTPPAKVEDRGQAAVWSFTGTSFSDMNSGFVLGGATAILATTDGGASWTPYTNSRFGSLKGVSAIDALHAQAVGGSGHAEEGIPFVTVSTDDGGRTWQPRTGTFGPGVEPLNFNAVSFTDPLHGHAVGDGGRIVATVDGGQTWKLQRSGGVEVLTGVSFTDEHRGVAVGRVTFTDGGQKALVLATDDGGANWTSRLVADTALLDAVDFSDRDTAYAVGCRKVRDDAEPTPHCLDGAIAKIGFVPPVTPGDPGTSWSSWGILAGVAVVGLTISRLLARRRRTA